MPLAAVLKEKTDPDGDARFGFEILSSDRNADALWALWRALDESADRHFFFTDWRWQASIAEKLLDTPVDYVRIDLDDEPVGLLPVEIQILKRGALSIPALMFPSHTHIELSDMVLKAGLPQSTLMHQLLRFLNDAREPHWQCLHFNGLVPDAALAGLNRDGTLYTEEIAASDYFVTAGDETYTLPRKLRRNIDRLATKANTAHGAVEMHVAQEGQPLMDAFERFLEVEASGWKGGDGLATAIKGDPRLVDFYRTLLQRFSEDASARINLLTFGGNVAAGQLCLRSGNIWSILKIGYDETFRDYGPGAILLKRVVEAAIDDPDTSEICLVTAPEWAERWQPQRRTVYQLNGFRNSLMGNGLHAVYHCMQFMKARNRKS
jgi:CelD/BcsL family acetyltransferase involved in cellulose biosynthesis